MTDRLDPAARRALMARIGSADTAPELVVRTLLHRMGKRFRLHVRNLPGTPDIVLPKLRLVVLVHGCFWHRHAGCARTTTPAVNRTFWTRKFKRNVERDAEVRAALRADGWRVRVVWECETRRSGMPRLEGRLRRWCDSADRGAGRPPSGR